MTKLHYALDVTRADEAVALAAIAAEHGVKIIEAGSLLVKIAGLPILSKLREVAPDAILVADLKTLDMGYPEVAAAAAAGADEVIIAAAASNATVTAAVESGRVAGVDILATLIGVDDCVARAQEIQALGVKVILGHNAIDDPDTWLAPHRMGLLKSLADALGSAFAVSGSLDLVAAEKLLALAPERMVVGRAITNSTDPAAALGLWTTLLG